MRFRGLMFRVYGLKFRVWGLRFRIQGLQPYAMVNLGLFWVRAERNQPLMRSWVAGRRSMNSYEIWLCDL